MMNLTTMNPATRRLIRVMPDEAEQTARMFDMLLGDDLDGRKDFIAKEGSNYIDMADVSRAAGHGKDKRAIKLLKILCSDLQK